MRTFRGFGAFVAAGIVAGITATAWSQAPEPAPTPTIWRFLGIPQTFQRLTDGTMNRFGNLPALERKPPVKKLADKANLESKNPAIKKAAEIKAEEDLAKQKIKAIKYLAKIGCGCYDKKGDITVKEALMAALDDCTEQVRYEAAKAIAESAGENCEMCNRDCCCDEALTEKLAEIVYEKDDKCCWKEPSERVREAAKEALCACCPGTGPMESTMGPDPETPGRLPEGPQPEAATPPMPPVDPESPMTFEVPEGSGVAPVRLIGPRKEKVDWYQDSKEEAEDESLPVREASLSRDGAEEATSTDWYEELTEDAEEAEETEESLPRSARVTARVTAVDAKRQAVRLALPEGTRAEVGTVVHVHHRFLLSMGRVADLEVVSSSNGFAVARPVEGTKLGKIARGDDAEILVFGGESLMPASYESR